jgi:hypothetical protein
VALVVGDERFRGTVPVQGVDGGEQLRLVLRDREQVERLAAM